MMSLPPGKLPPPNVEKRADRPTKFSATYADWWAADELLERNQHDPGSKLLRACLDLIRAGRNPAQELFEQASRKRLNFRFRNDCIRRFARAQHPDKHETELARALLDDFRLFESKLYKIYEKLPDESVPGNWKMLTRARKACDRPFPTSVKQVMNIFKRRGKLDAI